MSYREDVHVALQNMAKEVHKHRQKVEDLIASPGETVRPHVKDLLERLSEVHGAARALEHFLATALGDPFALSDLAPLPGPSSQDLPSSRHVERRRERVAGVQVGGRVGARKCTCRLEERNAKPGFSKDTLHSRDCPASVEPV